MKRLTIISFLLITACSNGTTLEKASRDYKANYSIEALEIITTSLRPGMKRGEIVKLLGEPSYCPGDNTCYYQSNKGVKTDSYNEIGTPTVVGLVVRYKVKKYGPSINILESFEIIPIGE